jgi:lysophospholipase L1-like esterase
MFSTAARHPLSAARFLALGDSYTIGEGVERSERWPALLTEALRGAGVALAAPEIIARTGWTTWELDAAIDEARPRGPYELVTLLIGVNDQYRGEPVAAYEPRFDGLLERAIGFAGGASSRVVVVSIPDWGLTPFASGRDRAAIAQALDAYNAANRRLAEARGARYVDIAAASREAWRDPARATGALAADGLHPSGALYARWAELALPAAVAALAAPGTISR